MQLSFSEPVNRHHFTLRCFPKENKRQRLGEQHVNIEPSYAGGMETDSFGNKCIYGLIEKAHMRFTVDVEGVAYILDDIYQPVEEPHRIGMFRYHTKLTEQGQVRMQTSVKGTKIMIRIEPVKKESILLDRIVKALKDMQPLVKEAHE